MIEKEKKLREILELLWDNDIIIPEAQEQILLLFEQKYEYTAPVNGTQQTDIA